MPVPYAYAPGKVILTGEHAVVYGQPAIAAPVDQVRARAEVEPDPRGRSGAVHILAPDIGLESSLDALPVDHPIATTIRNVQSTLNVQILPALTLRVSSTIPIASGLGSGAAIAVAISRALSAFLGSPLGNEAVSRIAFETDRFYHGTPSGIDNTVISYDRLVFFQREHPLEMLPNPAPFWLVIADSGEKSLTGVVVADLRRRIEADPEPLQSIIKKIGSLSHSARQAIEEGDHVRLGNLFNDNHALLQDLDVSSVKLDHLVDAARQVGALGAKLSGAGRGGNLIALVDGDRAEALATALGAAGATHTIISCVPKS